MTREERERIVAEAIEWMTEEEKFPGWEVDPKIDRALLESILIIHPRAHLVASLASMRMHWLPQGRTTTRAWRARLRNWCGARKTWDPLLSGIQAGPDFGGDELPARGKRVGQGAGSWQHAAGSKQYQRVNPERPALPEPVACGEIVKSEMAKIKALMGEAS